MAAECVEIELELRRAVQEAANRAMVKNSPRPLAKWLERALGFDTGQSRSRPLKCLADDTDDQ